MTALLDPFRTLFDDVEQYGMLLLDPLGDVLTWNLGAQRIYGYDSDEIIGRHISVLYTDQVARSGEPQRTLDDALARRRCVAEGWQVHKDRSRFWAHITISTVGDGDERCFAEIIRDDPDHDTDEPTADPRAVVDLRESVTQDIHHSIVRSIFDVGLTLEGARSLTTDPEVEARIAAAVASLDDAVKLVRRMVLDGSTP